MKIGANYLGDSRCEFTVWAPYAESIAVKFVYPQELLLPMERMGEYWRITAENIETGTLYYYLLNDNETRPDPASYSQPSGVHQASEVIDQSFPWNDDDWSGVPLDRMIIYELHVGTFTPEGTFDAIIPRLEDLREVGVNAIEIMPVAQFPGNRNWGYDGVYPFAVQNSYGGSQGLKKLVDACHQEGIAVILDVVYNHFGPEGNYTSRFGPYFTETYRTPWGSAINFDDAHSPGVRNFFIENALYWLRDYHIDALRLDAIHAIYDLGAKHFLEELAANVDAFSQEKGRKFYLIAESDLNNARIIRKPEIGGYGLDAQWSDDFHHALHSLLTKDNIGYYQDFGKCSHLAKAYKDSFVYDWQYSPFRQCYHGSPALDCPTYQFVVCMQNHDQIGNQLLGERLPKLVTFEYLKLAAGAVILSPYIPLLFMGEEYGSEVPFTYFVSHSDPDLIKVVRQGRKKEFEAFHFAGEPPDPVSTEIFNTCKLDWHKRKKDKHQVLLSFYQHLIRLRNSLPALINRQRQNMEVDFIEDEKVLWWRRWNENNQLLCLMNFNQNNVNFRPQVALDGWRKILDSADVKWLGNGSTLPETVNNEQNITVRSQSFALYEITL